MTTLASFSLLWQQAAQKRQLEEQHREWDTRRQELLPQVQAKHARWKQAETDLSLLDAGGVTGFLFRVAGNREGRLSAAQAEQTTAKAAYETAAWELASVEATLASLDRQLRDLGDDVPARLQTARAARLLAVKASDAPQVPQILLAEDGLLRAGRQRQAIEDLLQQQEGLLSTVHQVTGQLERTYGRIMTESLDTALTGTDLLTQQLIQNQEQLNVLLTSVLDDVRHWQETLDDLLRAPILPGDGEDAFP